MLLEAWAQAFPDGGQRLRVVGAGELEQTLRARAATLSGVELTGQVPRDRGLEILAGARALVVPSRWYEVFPRIVAEAYALGVPVIASRLGSLAEIVADGETGLHADPGDAADLARALRRLADDRDLAERLGAGARREYERNLEPQGDHRPAARDLLRNPRHDDRDRRRDAARRGRRRPMSVVAQRPAAATPPAVPVTAAGRARPRSCWWSVGDADPLLRRLLPLEDGPGHPVRRQAQRPHQLRPVVVDAAEVRAVHAGRRRRVRVRVRRPHRAVPHGSAAGSSNRDGVAARARDDRGAGGHRSGRLPRDAEPVRRLAQPGDRAACTRSRSGRPSFAPIATASASRRSSSRS